MSEEAAGVIVAYPYAVVDAAVAEFLRQQYGALTRRWVQFSSGSSHHFVSSGRTKVFEVAVRSIAPGSSEDHETLIVANFAAEQGETESRLLLTTFLHWWELDREGMEPFRRMLSAEDKPEIRLVKPSIVPALPPGKGASVEEWLNHRERMRQRGVRLTLKQLSKDSGISESTLRKASAARGKPDEQ